MKIELVGGPWCGSVHEVEFLNGTVRVGGYSFRRRDRGYVMDQGATPRCYNADGDRLYDYVKPDQRG